VLQLDWLNKVFAKEGGEGSILVRYLGTGQCRRTRGTAIAYERRPEDRSRGEDEHAHHHE
jgi:hypothetical protein